MIKSVYNIIIESVFRCLLTLKPCLIPCYFEMSFNTKTSLHDYVEMLRVFYYESVPRATFSCSVD